MSYVTKITLNELIRRDINELGECIKNLQEAAEKMPSFQTFWRPEGMQVSDVHMVGVFKEKIDAWDYGRTISDHKFIGRITIENENGPRSINYRIPGY